jgi:hypothetical protein
VIKIRLSSWSNQAEDCEAGLRLCGVPTPRRVYARVVDGNIPAVALPFAMPHGSMQGQRSSSPESEATVL